MLCEAHRSGVVLATTERRIGRYVALKTEPAVKADGGGVEFLLMRLQEGLDRIACSLHARPRTFSSAGTQSTDLVDMLGFERSARAARGDTPLFHDQRIEFVAVTPQLLRLLPGKRWIAPLFRVPGVLPLARRVYARIAAQRRCLVRGTSGD